MRKSRFFVFTAIILAFGLILGACDFRADITESPTYGEGGSDIAAENSNIEIETETKKETKKETEVIKPSKYTSEDKLVALTFDDGPRSSTTNRILDILEKHNSAATFFIVGYNIDNNVKTIKRAVDMGCEIANHSDSHKNLIKCTPEEIADQVSKPNETIKKYTGFDVRLFRAPGGNFKGVEETIGMPLIQWSIDTEDWKFKDASHKDRTPEQRNTDLENIVDRVMLEVNQGDIILMHDIYDFTADLCDLLIPRLIGEGYRLATVSEMYEAYGKELEGGKVYRCIKHPKSEVPALAAGAYLVETGGSVLNMRAKADIASEIVGKIENGTVVLVKKSVAGWSLVSYDSVDGWVSSKYLMKF